MAVEREVDGPSKVEGPSERDFVDRSLLAFGLFTFLNNVHFYLDARMVLNKGSILKPGIHKRDF